MPQRRSQDAPRPEPGRARRPRRRKGEDDLASDDQPAATAAPESQAKGAVVTISVEAVLWTALIGLALGLRFASLDHLPLTTGEGARAFAAWLVSQGEVPDGWPGDATAAVTSHLFRIFGSGETLARIVPAAAGSALVASFWFARRYVGRGVALLAGALIALSPLALLSSRSAFGFALGGFLSMVMVVALLAYLEQRRPLPIVVLAASFGLALTSDPVGTSAAIAIAAFVALEAAWRSGGAVSEAIATLRSTRHHWRPAALALAATLLLGVVQFGTDVDRLALPGLRHWLDIFAQPRDDLPWHYQLDLLFGYEWPLLLAGAGGYVMVVHRWIGKSQTPSLVQRLLLMWATVALIVVTFATQRESGQLLVLLIPFSLLAATLIEELLTRVDWGLLKRWWPTIALASALAAYALLQLSRWAREGGDISGGEKVYLVLALMGAAVIVAGGFYYQGRNGLALATPVAAALAISFLVHSSLSIGFGDGTEFAADVRLSRQVEPFRAEVARLAEERGLPVAVDPGLRDTLGWPLRDERVVFGDPAVGSPLVIAAGEGVVPAGYAPLGGPWLIGEGWAPDSFDPLPTWRWFVYRQRYGNLSSIEVQILEPGE